jgi:uncharacterized protein YehS (DUF1456 family)
MILLRSLLLFHTNSTPLNPEQPMINNDVLRRVRYALDLNDQTMIEIFALSDVEISRDHLLDLLKKDNQEGYVELDNKFMDAFLKGLITYKRGALEVQPGQPKKPELPLTNNSILKKLRIALNFKAGRF